jgi:hypothetical protein
MDVLRILTSSICRVVKVDFNLLIRMVFVMYNYAFYFMILRRKLTISVAYNRASPVLNLKVRKLTHKGMK